MLQKEISNLIDENGIVSLLVALREEVARRVVEETTSIEIKKAFDVLKCVMEEIECPTWDC